METKCHVYKSDKKAQTYLFLKTDTDQADLPGHLLHLLGGLTQFLSLSLTPELKLAQADIKDVLSSLDEQGYYLQMPPGETLKSQAPSSGFVQ